MKRDPRLHLDPTTRRYHERIAADEATADAAIQPAAWDAMSEPLSVALLARARGDVLAPPGFPPEGDLRCKAAFDRIGARLSGIDPAPEADALEGVLERRLAHYSGTRVPADSAQWFGIATFFQDWKSWGNFVRAVPVVAIEGSAPELARAPQDRAHGIESFGALRDDLDAALGTLDERRARAGDDWRWLDSVDRYADEAHLNGDSSLRSELLARVGAVGWLTWAVNLSHPVFTAVAINDVDDLDFIEALIEHCSEAPTPGESRRLVMLLIIRRAVELWEQIDRKLAWAAALTFGIEEADRLEYVRWLAVWSTTELPARTTRVAAILGGSPEGIDASIVVAGHLRDIQVVAPTGPVRARFREALLQQLAQLDIDGTLQRLLREPLSSPGLLAASLLAARAPSDARYQRIVGAYRTWISSTEFFWASPLDGHDREAVEAVAFALAHAQAPVAEARSVLSHVQRPSQGWGFDLDAWFDALPRVTHVLIVIAAAAAAALNGGRAAEAADLIEVSWNELDLLVRNTPTRLDDPRVASAVSYVWAYASRLLLLGNTARIGTGLARLDDVRMMVSAARNFTTNAGPLPIEAQRALKTGFAAHVVILDRHPHVSAEAFEELRTSVGELAPDAYAEAVPPP